MTNRFHISPVATLLASAAMFTVIWAPTAYCQPAQNAAKTPSLASQFVLSLPDYQTASPQEVENATNEFAHQRLRMIRLLTIQLTEIPLSNPSKTEVIRMLGELHANEAIGELIENINYFDDGPQGAPPTAARRRMGYIARNALSEIGAPAAQAILSGIGVKPMTIEGTEMNPGAHTYGFDASKADGFADVLIRVEGEDSFAARVVLFQLQQRQSEAQDIAVKAQFDLVIEFVKARLAQMEKAR